MTTAQPMDVVSAARSGSRAALAALYRDHADRVFTVAFRITGSRDDAEDVLQDVFVGLARALESYEERGRFASWLNRLTVRTSLMKLRAAQRRREQPLGELEEGAAHAPARADGVERVALRRALARLPAAMRVVFMLREVEGHSHDEIAELLGISAGASATRLSRAWSLLRKELMP